MSVTQQQQDPPYKDNVYKALKNEVGGFNLTPEEFDQRLSDPEYQKRVYKALKDNVQGFSVDETDFYTRIAPVKKKETTDSPQSTTQPSSQGAGLGWPPPLDGNAATQPIDKPSAVESVDTILGAKNPLAKGVFDFGRSLWSTLTDATPKAISQAGEVVNAQMEPSNIEEFIDKDKYVDFQRYVRDKDPDFAGTFSFLTPFDQKKYIEKHGEQFMIDSGYGDKIKEMKDRLPETIDRRLGKLAYAQEQDKEAAEKMVGATHSIEKVKSVTDALSYIGTVTGQAAGQIPMSVATRGLSSAVMESAAVYEQQVAELANKHNITKEDVIKQNLDRPAAEQSYAMLAASLDAASAGSILSAFRSQAAKSTIGQGVVNVVGEMVTEGAQGNLERYAAKSSAGVEFDPLSKENIMATVNEVIAGGLGGGVFSFAPQGNSQFAKRETEDITSNIVNETPESVNNNEQPTEEAVGNDGQRVPGQDDGSNVLEADAESGSQAGPEQEVQEQKTPEEIASAAIDDLVASGDVSREGGKVTILTPKGGQEAKRIHDELIKAQSVHKEQAFKEREQTQNSEQATPEAPKFTEPERITTPETALPKKTFSQIESDINTITNRADKSVKESATKLQVTLNPFKIAHTILDKGQKAIFDNTALDYRKAENALAKIANKGLKSKNYIVRNATGVLKNIFGGLSYDQTGVKNKREFTGLKNYANVYAKQLNDDLHSMVDNNPKSLRLLQMSLDPETALKENAQYTVLQDEKKTLNKSLSGKRSSLTTEKNKANPDITKIDKIEREIMDIEDQMTGFDTQEKDIQTRIQQSAMDSMNDNEKTLYDILRETNNYGHEWYHDNGLLDDETYKKNKGSYIARLYEQYELEDPEIVRQFNSSRADLGMFNKREDFADVQAEIVRDPVYATAKRVAQMMRTQAIFEYADSVLNSKTIEVSGIEKPGYTQLGKPGDKKYYGALTGKFVPNYIAEDFKGFFFGSKMMESAYDFVKNYDKNVIRQFMKKYNTVYNPVVQFGNFMSNFAFAFVAGVDPLTMAQKQVEARSDIANNGQDYIDLVKAGIIGTDIIQTDLSPILEQTSGTGALGAQQNTLKEKVMNTKVGKALDKIDRWSTSVYGRIDDMSKLAAYKALVEGGYSKEEAIDRVYDSFQNYATVGKLYDFAAKTPVIGNPYIKFKADLGRIMKNGATRRPLTTSVFLASLYLMSQVLSDASDEDEDVRKARERRPFTPKIKLPGDNDISLLWQVPGVGEVNMARFISPYYNYDLGGRDNYVNAFTDWMPYQFDLAEMSTSKDVSIPVPDFADVLWGPYAQVMFDRDFRGMSVRDPKGNQFVTLALPDEQIANSINYIARSQVPLYRTAQDMTDAFNGNMDYYGRNRSITQALMNNVIKVQEFGSEQAKDQLQKEISFRLTSIEMLEKEIGRITNAAGKELAKIQNSNISSSAKESLKKDRIEKMKKQVAHKIDQIKAAQQELEEPAELLKSIN